MARNGRKMDICFDSEYSFVVSSKLKSKIRFQKLEKHLGPHKLSKSYKAKKNPMSNYECLWFLFINPVKLGSNRLKHKAMHIICFYD